MTCAEIPRRLARLAATCLLATLVACGGGGGSTGGSGGTGTTVTTGTTSSTGSTTPVALTNSVAVTIDDGPAALGTGSDATRAVDEAFVSVTICAPGTSNCQTIDHIQVDTGSVGLRIAGSVIGSGLLAALPRETDPQGNPVGECYGFVNGYVFGSVRQTDFKIGSVGVSGMPIQVIGDTGAFATIPSSCSSGGGDNISTVKGLAANGILGIGVTSTDCGQACTGAGGFGAALYYDCPSSGCAGQVARAASTTAPFQQLPNPVSAMAQDNNGTVLVLPAVPSGGAATLTGTLYFGIGTQSNNGLGSARPLTTTDSTARNGVGLVSVSYNGRTLPDSFIDSGSNAYFFTDTSIPACTSSSASGFYCPASPRMLTPIITGANGAVYDANLTLYNAQSLFASGDAALPGLGSDPGSNDQFQDISAGFDFGLPFFFGHSIFTAIEGSTAAGVAGPYFAIG